MLDFDATDDIVHGLQEGRFFHGYYGNYCFLPLYVFCGDFPLVAYLRPANVDGARHFGAVLKLLVRALRARWPDVRITVRADSGFCRKKVLRWCEHECIDYVIGIARNAVLERLAEPWLAEVEARSEVSGESRARLRGSPLRGEEVALRPPRRREGRVSAGPELETEPALRRDEPR